MRVRTHDTVMVIHTRCFMIQVVVTDWEQAGWQCEVALEMTVTDTNDNPPSYGPGTHATTTLPEDAPVNTVFLKMLATDPDLGK